MALNPNTVHVGGPMTKVNDFPASTAITPGMVIELHRDSDGAKKWRPHSADTAIPSRAVALEILGKGPDDAYAANDLVHAAIYETGGMFWGLLPSGQNIQNAENMQSNGDGRLKTAGAAAAADGVGIYRSLEEIGSVTVQTRVVVEVI